MPNEDEPSPASASASSFSASPDTGTNASRERQALELVELTTEARNADPGLRKIALNGLLNLGAQGIEPLLTLLNEHMRKRRNVRRLLFYLAWLLVPVSIIMAPAILLSICMNSSTFILLAFGVWIVNWLLFVLRSRLPLTRRQKEIADAFTKLNDSRAVGFLVEALSPNPDRDPPMLRATLVRLLKQLRATDAALLDSGQRAILYRELLTPNPQGPQMDFVLALLQALEQVGTMEAQPYVAQLARRSSLQQSNPVQEAAMRCLEFLQAKSGDQTTRQMLLRASAQGEARPESLLRPARENQTPHADQLLRADTFATPPDTPQFVSPDEEPNPESKTE